MSTDIHARHPGPRSWLAMVRYEGTMVARDTAGLIVPIGLPLLILVTSSSAVGDEVIANGRTALDLYVIPLVLTMVIASIGVINMPSFLAYYRRAGILRRLSVTPASPVMVLVAQVAVSAIQAAFGIAVALTVAFTVFDANPPADLGATVLVFLLAMAAMYAVGMIVAAVSPTPNSAVAIGLVAFLGLGALGGMFGGRAALPDAVAAIGERLPFGAAVEALAMAWAGGAVDPLHLLSLGATVVVGTVIAAAFFRWD
ncbi:ABC-2 type transport system permease protein [Murinocardiopsis flavida]|uniref:ABC-2 type transport system permease protein n=1 Tax=Murinocardiopsis flavida TaxID=645275 RepID=A0A2P8DSR4_9ACTN|nr:ABC transporter permease [Murinocardiopsis flavida]PSL00235.1 ABC-2 type transport system permease protein [Murinocardiopsis flavida]